MKASTQYNNFTGTSAADVSDHTSLGELLRTQGLDTERYKPIGAGFYASYENGFYPAIYCVDNQRGTNENPFIIKVAIDASILSKDAFFLLFKRMDVEFTVKATSFREGQRQSEVEYAELEDLLSA